MRQAPARAGASDLRLPTEPGAPIEASLELYRKALVALNDMNIALHEAKNLDELLQVLVVKAFEGLGFDRGLIYLVEGDYLRVAAAIDLIRMEHGGVIRRRIGYDLTREQSVEIEALRSRRPIHVRDAPRDPRVSAKFRRATSDTEEYCAVPILGRGEPIGVMTIDKFYSKAPITAVEDFLLEIFARHVGVAIESLLANMDLEQRVEVKGREVRRLQGFLEAVFANLPAAILTVDGQGWLTAANPAARRLLHLPALPLPSPREAIPAEAMSRAVPLLRLLDRCLEAEPVEEKTLRLGGEDARVLKVSTAPLLDARGEAIGAVAVGTDVTDKVKIEETLQRMDRLSALGTLAAGVAHEIRNPLAGVSGLVQVLQGRLADVDPRGRLVEKIVDEVARLNRIVGDLLRFSRQGRAGPEGLDPAALVERVLLLCRKDLEARKIWVRRELDPGCPQVTGEVERIQQALLNLILNAAHAMKGGGELTLRVGGAPAIPGDLEGLWRWLRAREGFPAQPRSVVLTVRDSGEGMTSEVLNQVFHPFFTTKREGTGLGLYIVHRIAEEHGGVVLPESRLGEGSAFHLVLPVRGAGKDAG